MMRFHLVKVRGVLAFVSAMTLVVLLLTPVGIFIHEGAHYITYSLEGISVTSFHVLDEEAFESGHAGYVTVARDSRYGDFVQEAIAYFIMCFCLFLMTVFCFITVFRKFTVHQFDRMGVYPVKRRTASQGGVNNAVYE